MDDEREANQAEPEVARPGPIVSASPVVWPSESLPADESQAPAGWASAAPVNRPGVIVVGPGLVLAGIGTRIAAVLVDGFILSGAAITITGASAGLTADRNVSYVVAAFVSAILAVGYFAVGWLSPWAATPGQRLAGLRVLDAATLDRIDVGRAILRSLLLGAALNIVSFAAPVSRLFGAVLIV